MKENSKDVAYIFDAIECIGELGCAEDHCLSNFIETGENNYLELAYDLRKDRSKILDGITIDVGECWCLNKHLSKVVKLLRELGNRKMEEKDLDFAKELFEKADTYKKVIIIINKKEGK